MSYQEGSCRYLEDLQLDYKKKLEDNFWRDLHEFIREELFRTEYRLHALREQDLCLHFQMQGTSLSTFLMTN